MIKVLSDFIDIEYSKIGIKNRFELKEKTQNVFSKYLVNKDRTFKLYIDLLCGEFVKYNKITADKKLFSFLKEKF